MKLPANRGSRSEGDFHDGPGYAKMQPTGLKNLRKDLIGLQLDQTHVKIRVRTLSEIGDLSLLMIRRYPKAFFHAFFLGAGLWMLADLLLLGWLPLEFTRDDLYFDDTSADLSRYLLWMPTLVFLQTPLAGAIATSYLGQAVFEREPSIRQAFQDVRGQFWSLLWHLGFVRLPIPAMVLLLFRWGEPANAFFDVFVPIMILIVAALVRSNRPFLAEMILLERCPVRSNHPAVITLKRRSKALHNPMSGELGGRFLTVAMTLLALLGCVYYTFVFLRGIALGYWETDTIAALLFFPMSLWLIASFSVIVRLLNYLDARIRLEGWEVELAIRAEAIRQFGEDFIGVATVSETQSQTEDRQREAVTTDSNVDTGASPSTAASPTQTDSSTVLRVIAWWFAFAIGLAGSQVCRAEGAFLLKESGKESLKDSSIFALADVSSPVVDSSVWYDPEQRQLKPIEVKDQRSDSVNRDSRWVPKPPKVKKQPAPATNTTTGTTGGGTSWLGGLSIGNLFGWLLLAALVGVLVTLLVYVFSQSSFDFGPASSDQVVMEQRVLDQQTKQRIAELPEQLRGTDVNPRSELQRLMNAGDYDRAIVFLYGHQLLMLDRAGLLRLSRWKTNNQYVREAKRSVDDAAENLAGGSLADTVRAFERSYFGRHAISQPHFEELWTQNLRLESWLQQRAGAKA